MEGQRKVEERQRTASDEVEERGLHRGAASGGCIRGGQTCVGMYVLRSTSLHGRAAVKGSDRWWTGGERR